MCVYCTDTKWVRWYKIIFYDNNKRVMAHDFALHRIEDQVGSRAPLPKRKTRKKHDSDNDKTASDGSMSQEVRHSIAFSNSGCEAGDFRIRKILLSLY